MTDQPQQKEEKRIALTARLSLRAYDAIMELKRKHRFETGKALPIWKILDEAVIQYAKKQNGGE